MSKTVKVHPSVSNPIQRDGGEDTAPYWEQPRTSPYTYELPDPTSFIKSKDNLPARVVDGVIIAEKYSTPANSTKKTSQENNRRINEIRSFKRRLAATPLEVVPEYEYDLNMSVQPDYRDKMWEMAIARRSSNGSKLPANKFNGGKYGPV